MSCTINDGPINHLTYLLAYLFTYLPTDLDRKVLKMFYNTTQDTCAILWIIPHFYYIPSVVCTCVRPCIQSTWENGSKCSQNTSSLLSTQKNITYIMIPTSETSYNFWNSPTSVTNCHWKVKVLNDTMFMWDFFDAEGWTVFYIIKITQLMIPVNMFTYRRL